MPQTLASDMARKSLDVLLDRVERQHAFSAQEARELLNGCVIQVTVLDRLWEQIQRSLDRGIEGKQLRYLVEELVDALDRGTKAFRASSEKVKAADLPSPENAEGMSMLESAVQRAVDRRGALSGLLGRLETPPREFDPRALPPGRENPAATGYIGLDELTGRLLSPKQT
jgi:hypothetical protein